MYALANNVPAHFNEIMADIQQANIEIQRGNYFEYGQNIGEVLVLAVGQAKAFIESMLMEYKPYWWKTQWSFAH